MNGLFYVIVLLTPLAVLASGWYRHAKWSLVLATLPPLMASLLIPVGEKSTLGWLLLGSRLGTDAITHWLWPATALVWAAAAVHHAQNDRQGAHPARFRLFFLLAMCGNLMLLLAQDAVTFYVGYAMMGLAGYGLVMDRRSTSARIAAGTYLRWTIAGELMLFSGLLSLAHDVGATTLPLRDTAAVSAWTLVLLISGFGIKIGLPGLHAWMPGTYAASSTPGSAVFSGAMANAGILGLLHFLPLQQAGYATAGMLLLAFGLFGAIYGVLLGLPQRHPKTILAYSSISQLGTLAAMAGLALMQPGLAPALIIAITVYAVHHGLTKAALFFTLDGLEHARWRSLSLAVLIVLSTMMAGLPFSSGAVAKSMVKGAIGDDHARLVTLLAIASIATTLLMTRFLFVSLAKKRKAHPVPFMATAGLGLVLLIVAHIAVYQVSPLPALDASAIWPLIFGMALMIPLVMLPARGRRALQPLIPKGDLPTVLARVLLRLASRFQIKRVLADLRGREGSVFLPTTDASLSSRIEGDPGRRGQ